MKKKLLVAGSAIASLFVMVVLAPPFVLDGKSNCPLIRIFTL